MDIFQKLSNCIEVCDRETPFLHIFLSYHLNHSTALKRNEGIKGVSIDGVNVLTSQYADDAIICLDGSEESLRNTLETLQAFAKISGLLITRKKPEQFGLGRKRIAK